MRSIRKVIKARRVNMGGHFLDQPLPLGEVDYIDPFLLLHHWKQYQQGGVSQKDIGVGPHPHRGFSPVTFIFEGSVQHRDSRGNNSIINSGGTQWMNSGMGIIHSERPGKEIAKDGGMVEFIQFWVNTPAKHKMDEPSYQPLTKEETPLWTSDDKLVKIWVVNGEYKGLKGKIKTYTDILALRIEIKKGGKTKMEIPESFNAFTYQLDGKLSINQETNTSEKDLVWFNNDGKYFEVEALEDTRFIILSAEPLREEVSTYGPFVMNTQTEIMEAMRDYQMGKMGMLIEEFDDEENYKMNLN